MSQEIQGRGYLHEPFRIFYLEDLPAHPIALHYHDFSKIIILLDGSLTYEIEGRSYELQSKDMVFVNAGEIHRPILTSASRYQRVIIYFSAAFFKEYESAGIDRCFSQMQKAGSHVPENTPALGRLITEKIPGLIHTDGLTGDSARLLVRSRLLEFLLLLQHYLESRKEYFRDPVVSNPMIAQILSYISAHLRQDLTIEDIAAHVHVHRSYLMHLFRQEMNCTIMSYITDKRLFLANEMLRQGDSATKACYESGFTSYPSFYRSYVKRYGHSPKQTNSFAFFGDIY